MKDLIKNAVAMTLTAAISAAIGIGAVKAYQASTNEKPPVVETGDYSRYFSQTSGDVVLFGTSTCPYCENVRQYLQERNIDYVDLVVDQDKVASQLYEDLGARAVPVLLVGNTRVNGYSPEHLRAALDIMAAES